MKKGMVWCIIFTFLFITMSIGVTLYSYGTGLNAISSIGTGLIVAGGGLAAVFTVYLLASSDIISEG